MALGGSIKQCGYAGGSSVPSVSGYGCRGTTSGGLGIPRTAPSQSVTNAAGCTRRPLTGVPIGLVASATAMQVPAVAATPGTAAGTEMRGSSLVDGMLERPGLGTTRKLSGDAAEEVLSGIACTRDTPSCGGEPTTWRPCRCRTLAAAWQTVPPGKGVVASRLTLAGVAAAPD